MISVRPVLICLVILVAEFAVLEGALRVYSGSEAAPSFQSILMQDPRIGHRLKPDARTRYTTVEFSTEIVINAQGVRDDQDIGPKAPGERRVLVLGDSLVLSVQVPLEQTFCKQLEARLAAADPAHRWRVINGGVQGYGPVKDWLFYRNVAEAFQPDIVMIVAFVGNDAVEANDDEPSLNAGRVPTAELTDAAMNRVRRLTRTSMVLQLTRLRVEQIKDHFRGPGTERPLATYLDVPPPEVVHGLEVTRRAFGMISARAAELGARTALVLMPARFQTDDADYERLVEIVHHAGAEVVRNAATERFREALSPLGVPTLDLLPVLAAEPSREELFFQRNIHLTQRGHTVVADAMFRFLKDSRLVELQRP
jgi:lysophospholipase L1-like esterase